MSSWQPTPAQDGLYWLWRPYCRRFAYRRLAIVRVKQGKILFSPQLLDDLAGGWTGGRNYEPLEKHVKLGAMWLPLELPDTPRRNP